MWASFEAAEGRAVPADCRAGAGDSAKGTLSVLRESMGQDTSAESHSLVRSVLRLHANADTSRYRRENVGTDGKGRCRGCGYVMPNTAMEVHHAGKEFAGYVEEFFGSVADLRGIPVERVGPAGETEEGRRRRWHPVVRSIAVSDHQLEDAALLTEWHRIHASVPLEFMCGPCHLAEHQAESGRERGGVIARAPEHAPPYTVATQAAPEAARPATSRVSSPQRERTAAAGNAAVDAVWRAHRQWAVGVVVTVAVAALATVTIRGGAIFPRRLGGYGLAVSQCPAITSVAIVVIIYYVYLAQAWMRKHARELRVHGGRLVVAIKSTGNVVFYAGPAVLLLWAMVVHMHVDRLGD